MPDRNSLQGKATRSRSGGRKLPVRGPRRGPSDFPVVGIGASAGGLEACKKLVGALPAGNGMAFILVQHLDPTHESMMVDLLAGHTTMTVRRRPTACRSSATTSMSFHPGRIFPSRTALCISRGPRHVTARGCHSTSCCTHWRRNAARAPSASSFQAPGPDGSLGLKAVKEEGGHVIAQDPDEAGYDGMPRSAIMTGAVDLVLAGGRNSRRARRSTTGGWRRPARRTASLPHGARHRLAAEIIDLLRTKTAHDFTLYKPGTLQRRIERRMAMAAIKTGDMDRYLDLLRATPANSTCLPRTC